MVLNGRDRFLKTEVDVKKMSTPDRSSSCTSFPEWHLKHLHTVSSVRRKKRVDSNALLSRRQAKGCSSISYINATLFRTGIPQVLNPCKPRLNSAIVAVCVFESHTGRSVFKPSPRQTEINKTGSSTLLPL